AFGTTVPSARLGHAHGKAFRDVIRGLRRDFAHAPDCVALPADEDELARLLDWCQGANVAAIPYGGGSSVVGGVEPAVGEGYAGAVSIDLRRFDRVLEVDAASRAARIQAGVYGPALEAQLKAYGLTLRHYPQSFEFSTLGGWIATRSGGHYATLHTRIDDFVASLRVLTPRGPLETRRLPASGAGPDSVRLYLGSEGTLGIITEAWMRLQQRPRYRSSASVRFDDFLGGARAVRALVQSGLHPANCRLLEAVEARDSGVGDGRSHLLLLGFESAAYSMESAMRQALECCADHGGRYDPTRVRHRIEEAALAEQGARWQAGAASASAGEGRRDGNGSRIGANGQTGTGAGAAADRTTGSSRQIRAGARATAGSAAGSSGHAEEADAWRRAFLRMPYLRDALAMRGVIVETFETAVTWDRFEAFHAAVMAATQRALDEACGPGGWVSCRFTHAYPDGVTPYYTVK